MSAVRSRGHAKLSAKRYRNTAGLKTTRSVNSFFVLSASSSHSVIAYITGDRTVLEAEFRAFSEMAVYMAQ